MQRGSAQREADTVNCCSDIVDHLNSDANLKLCLPYSARDTERVAWRTNSGRCRGESGYERSQPRYKILMWNHARTDYQRTRTHTSWRRGQVFKFMRFCIIFTALSYLLFIQNQHDAVSYIQSSSTSARRVMWHCNGN